MVNLGALSWPAPVHLLCHSDTNCFSERTLGELDSHENVVVKEDTPSSAAGGGYVQEDVPPRECTRSNSRSPRQVLSRSQPIASEH